ncbi:MAG: hypothetical protein M1383_06180 [Patescibacteria group bacterium]|nr:hypothetical protein [Patescibacteria group bacterium]
MAKQGIFDTSSDTHQLVHKKLVLGKIDDPQPVFFYQRRDGSVFSCGEDEAFTVHEFYITYGGFVGRSDGRTSHEALLKLKEWQDGEIGKLHLKLRGAKSKIRRLERKNKLTKKEEAELDELYDLDENFDEHVEKIVDKVKAGISEAWKAELKAARGNFIPPQDLSVIGGGQTVGSDGRMLSSRQFFGLGGLKNINLN